jgi:2-aminoadipate transaminase
VAVSVLPDPGVISFARGVPSPDMFPLELLAACAEQAVREDGRVALNYGPAAGYAPLQAWVAEQHGVAPERVLLTPGSLIGLNLVVRRLCPGREALVEAPTYDRMLHALADAGGTAVPVPRGEDGLDLDRLTEVARRRPALLYVLPTFHNPTGRTLDEAQRRALVEVAVAHDLPVFEDDPYGLVRIDGEPQPRISTLLREAGRDDLAMFAASFSKTVAPGLRVGFLVLPEHLVGDLSTAISRTYVSPPMLPQAQLYAFLAGGHLEPHLADLGRFLQPRRDALIAALEGLGDGVRFTRPGGGYFLWLELAEHVDAAELEQRARAAGVTFVPGAGFYAGEPRRSTARLAFSFSTVEEIREGAARLVELIRAAL